MKYYSEETVLEVMARSELAGEDWGDCKPIDLKDYPSIELPDKFGRLIEADALLNSIPELEPDLFENCSNCNCLDSEGLKRLIIEAPTVLEASE